MGLVDDRIDGFIDRYGESLDFTTLAGVVQSPSTVVTGIYRILDRGTMSTYLNDTEMLGVVRPGAIVFLKSDTTVVLSDVFSRDGRDYYILRILDVCFKDSVVFKFAICG